MPASETEYKFRQAMWGKVKSAARLAAEVAECEANGQQAVDQKKKALTMVDEVVNHEDIDVSAALAAADIAFLLGARNPTGKEHWRSGRRGGCTKPGSVMATIFMRGHSGPQRRAPLRSATGGCIWPHARSAKANRS